MADFVEVFDPEYKYVKEVPATSVRHLPPQRLNITRLVFCRNYVPGDALSCSMGDGCKFVHADVDPESLEAHPIHVKYAWRHEDVCTYARLPAGEILRVTAPNNRPPVEEIPSERVLVTRGSLRRDDNTAPPSHCAHYYFNRMCNRGERCNFIHVVHVDPNVVGDFKRAPARCVVSVPRPDRSTNASARAPRSTNAVPLHDIPQPARFSKLYNDAMLSEKLAPHSMNEADRYPDAFEAARPNTYSAYRHNPYSLLAVTVPVVPSLGA